MKFVSAQEELTKLLDLLKIELQEDKKQYEEKILKLPLQERKEQGLSWYPLVIKESYYGIGERLILELERPTHREISHQFQFGSLAKLYTMHDSYKDEPHSIAGVVSSVSANNLRLTLFVDELPEWVDMGKLGLDLLFDESSYKEMEEAVKEVMKAKNNRLAQLREILLGYETAQFKELKDAVSFPELNQSQNEAIRNIAQAKDVAIIHGPPGTGKTTTLVKSILHTLKTEHQVMVCAASNSAVDLLAERLHQQGVNVLRIGHPSRVNEELLSLTLDDKMTKHSDYKYIKEYKKRAQEFKNMAAKYKRHFGKSEREQRQALLQESRKLIQEADQLEKFISNDLLTKAQVVACTLVGSNNYLLKEKTFHSVFIDEAAQALEPACWIPIRKATRIIFAGDHCQLPPTVKSYEAGKAGLSVTLFEKTIQRQQADVMLKVQYRMNEKIMAFSNKHFYKGELEAHDHVKHHTLYSWDEQVVEFVDSAGCSFDEEQKVNSTSTSNPEEARLLFRHLARLVGYLDPQETLTLGLISPYKAQVNLLGQMLPEAGLPGNLRVTVNSVDGFQGQERDIIYISLVRSNAEGEIGFLADTRRMNVAMTRARKKLVIIGDSSTIASHFFYKDFLSFVEANHFYKSAWEYPQE